MRRRQSSATWLLLAHIGLIIYASLYPFWPWRWPPGMGLPWLFGLNWPTRFWAFDVEVNLLGYIPLGLLGFAAAIRSGWGLRAALVLGLVNTLVRPVLVILTLPVTILTLGLFIFIINALLFLFVGNVLAGFHVASFGTALLGSVLYSVISWLLSSLLLRE